MSEPAFWTCRIGPADRDSLPEGADSPLRMAVKEVFQDLIGHHALIISSGWGRNESSEPYLGLATTRQLLEELKIRGELSAKIGEYPGPMTDLAIGAAQQLILLPGSMLDYRSVDS